MKRVKDTEPQHIPSEREVFGDSNALSEGTDLETNGLPPKESAVCIVPFTIMKS